MLFEKRKIIIFEPSSNTLKEDNEIRLKDLNNLLNEIRELRSQYQDLRVKFDFLKADFEEISLSKNYPANGLMLHNKYFGED